VATAIEPLENFFPAEEWHQDFYQKNPTRYKNYSLLSGRESHIAHHRGQSKINKDADKTKNLKAFIKPDQETLRSWLSEQQFKVTQKNGTEPAFRNEYWDNKKEGMWMWSPGNPCSHPKTSSTPVQGGPVLPVR